jgi:acyl-CoA thioesterase-2
MPESASASRATEVTFSDLLNLEDHGDGRYRGACHEGAPARAFGGQVAAQAFTAAAKTAPAGQEPASMHAYFAKAATAGEPVDYVVTVAGDGNSLSHRSVTALQRGRTVLLLTASFHRPEEGPARWRTPAGPGTPPADQGPGDRPGHRSVRELAVEQLPAAPEGSVSDPGLGHYARWMRARSAIGDDPALQAGAVIYMADMVLARGRRA